MLNNIFNHVSQTITYDFSNLGKEKNLIMDED